MLDELYNIIHKDKDVMNRTLLLFYILSNKTRLKILLLLCIQEMNVKELENELDQSQSAISHQLSLLRQENLVIAEKVGREQYYRVTDNHIELILNIAINHIIEEHK